MTCHYFSVFSQICLQFQAFQLDLSLESIASSARHRRLGRHEHTLDPRGVDARGGEIRITHDPPMKGQRRRNALDLHLIKRPPHGHQHLVSVRRVHDQFAHHRIVIGRHHVARPDMRIPPHSASARHPQRGNLARGWPVLNPERSDKWQQNNSRQIPYLAASCRAPAFLCPIWPVPSAAKSE